MDGWSFWSVSPGICGWNVDAQEKTDFRVEDLRGRESACWAIEGQIFNEFIYSGLEAEIILISLIQRYWITGGTVRLVQSAVIGGNMRILTGILGGVTDGAAVRVAVGAVWLAEHSVCMCAAR